MPRRPRTAASLNVVQLEDRTAPAILLTLVGNVVTLTEDGAAVDTVTVSRDPDGLKIDLGAANFKAGSFDDPNFVYATGDNPVNSSSVVVKNAVGKGFSINTGANGDAVTFGADDLAVGAVTITGTALAAVTLNKTTAESFAVSNATLVTVAGVLTAESTLTVTAGTITATADMSATGNATLTAPTITVVGVSSGSTLQTTGALTATGPLSGSVAVNLSGGAVSTKAVSGGALTMSGGDVELGGAVTSASVTANIPANTFKAPGGINTAGLVSVTASTAQFTTVTAGGTLTVTAGTITATAGLTATGNAKLTGTTTVVGVASTAGRVEIAGAVTATGTLSGMAGVDLSGPSVDTKAITGGALTVTTTGGGNATLDGLVNSSSVTADTTGGTFKSTVGIATAGLVSIKAATATLGMVDADGNVTVDAATITVTGDMTAAGDAKLTGTTVTVGLVSSDGTLEVNGKLTATGTLSGATAVNLSGATITTAKVSGGALTIGGGDVTLGAAVTSSSVTANITGAFKAPGGISTVGGVTVDATTAEFSAVTATGTIDVATTGTLEASDTLSGGMGVLLFGSTVTTANVTGGALTVGGGDATLGGAVTSASVAVNLTGDFNLTGTITTAGTVSVTAQNAALGTTTAGGTVTVNVAGLTTLAGVVTGPDVTVKTNTIATAGGGLTALGGVVAVAPQTLGRDIQLAGIDPGTVLYLGTATLNAITAPAVVIGDLTNTGDILVAGAVTPPGFTTLTLLATGNVTQNGGATLTLGKLSATAADVDLTGAANAVAAVAGAAAGGGFDFAAQGPLNVLGVTADQAVNIGTTAGALTVPAAAVVQSTGGNVSLVSGAALAITAGATVRTIAPAGTIALGVNGVANVSGAALTAAGGVTINGGGGNDTFNLTPSASAKISVVGGAGTDALNLTTSGAAVVNTGNTLAVAGFQDITHTGVESVALVTAGAVTVTGTNAPDTLVLDRTSPATIRYVLNGGVPVSYDGASLTFDALDGDDTLRLEFAGGSPLPAVANAASLIFQGGAGADTLAVVGTAGYDEFAYDPAGPSFRFSAPTVPLTPAIPQQVERLTFDGGGGQDCFDVTAGGQDVEFAPTGVSNAGTVTVGANAAEFTNVGGVDVRNAATVTAKLPAATGLVTIADDTLFCAPAAALRVSTPSPIPVLSVAGAANLTVRPGDAVTDVLVGPVSPAGDVASLTLGLGVAPLQNVQFNGAVEVTGVIAVDADGVAFAGPSVRSGGPQSYTTPVAGVVGPTTLTATAGGVTFTGNVGVFSDLTMTAAGAVSVGGDVTGTAALVVNTPAATTFTGTVTAGSVTTDAPGTTAINGGSVDTTGNQTFNDAVTLGANTTFTGVGVTFAKTLVAPAKTATVNASGTTTFGGAVAVLALATDAAGTTAINGGAVDTTGNQTFADAVTLGANAALTSTGGVVDFGGTVDGPGGLTVGANAVTFGNTVGVGTKLAFLTANAPATVNGDVRTVGDQAWNGVVTVGANTAFAAGGKATFAQALGGAAVVATAGGTLTFGGPVAVTSLAVTAPAIQVDGGAVTTAPGSQTYTGPVTIGADTTFAAGADITFAGTLTGATKTAAVNAPGTTTFGGAVNVQAISTDAAGVTKINGGSVDTTGNQTFADAVILGANAALTSAAVVSFGGTVDGPGGLTATAATVVFGGTVGVGAKLAFLTANGPATVTGDVRTVGDQAWNGVVSVAADTAFATTGNTSFAQALSGAGQAVSVTAGGVAAFGGAVTAASLVVAAAQVDVNGGSVATGPGSQTFTGPVVLGANTTFLSGGDITFTTTLTGTNKAAVLSANGTITLGGAVAVGSLTATATTTAVDGGAVTTPGDQTYTGAVTLGVATALTGGSLLFNGPLDGPGALTASAASLTFNGPVGQTVPLAGLTANAPAVVSGGFVGTVADLTWNGTVGLGADAVMQSGGNVTFAQVLAAGGRSLTVTAAGAAAFGADVNSGPLTVTSGAGTTFAAPLSAESLTLTSGGATVFGAAVNNGNTAITSAGPVTFAGPVVAGSIVAAAPSFAVNGGSVATTGSQTFNGPVVIGTDTAFTAAGSISITPSLDGATDGGQAVSFGANGVINLGAVGATNRLRAVVVTSAVDATFASVRGGSFVQQAGTGTTQFSGGVEVGLLHVTTGAVRILSDITTGDAAFTTSTGGVSQLGGLLSAANLSLVGVGPFDVSRPANVLAGTVRADISGGDVTVAVAGNLTVDPAGVRVGAGNVVFRTGGNFTVEDKRGDAERYTTPLIDLGNGGLTVFTGLAGPSVVTVKAEVRATGATFVGGGAEDLFDLRPSAVTPYTVAGNAPTIPLPPGADGDELRIQFVGADVFRFQYDGQDGLYQFKNRQQIAFTGIETLARFGIAGFVVQTGEPNDATGATRQQYAVRMIRTQDGVPLGGGIDGSGLAENPFVVSPVRVSTGTALSPPRITFADVNGDGVQDLILANGPGAPPLVSVIDGLRLDEGVDGSVVRLDALPASALLAQFFAYDPTFFGGVNVAAGDLDGDGRSEIVTAADHGGGPHIRTFTFAPTGTGFAAVQFPGKFGSFFAYEPSFRGGARVAVGDFDGDKVADIIIGTGVGGGPRVLVMDVRTGVEKRSFFAYDDSYRGGVYVDAGDYDQDGFADVLTAPGAGGAAHIRVFSGRETFPGGQPRDLASFLAFDSTGDSDPLLGQFQSRLGVGGVGFGGFSAAGSRDILVATPRGVTTRVMLFAGNRGNPTSAVDLLSTPQFSVPGPDNQPVTPPSSQLFYGAAVGGFSIDDVLGG